MKTPSLETGFRIIHNRGKRESQRLITLVLLAAGAVFIFAVADSTAVAGGTDFCKQISQAALRSCRLGAQSDYSLAFGKCDNVSDPVARKACQDQAKADLKDALQTCAAQHDARQTVCQRLGGATYEPSIIPSNFVATIDNPFYPLTPGTTFIYTGLVASAVESNVVFVTHNTKVILGVTCVEVRDTVFTNGELTEDTLDWFAQDKDGNVWYFGENTHELEGNEITNIDGSFKGGVGGAKPGIVMKAHPAIGNFYRQEFDLDNAEDVAEVVGLTNSATVPFGSFTNCLMTKETSPLEPDASENKFYATGVGNVLVIDLVTGERSGLVQVLP